MIEDQYLEPTGLLPPGEAELFVAPTAEYFVGLAMSDSFDNVAPAATTPLKDVVDGDMRHYGYLPKDESGSWWADVP
ncbi:hypothetical protein V3M41_00320 [Trueperella pyogenes]|uniref:hypothetical protein n=1 Tax=Trueperella pyogenes TaxID=1661 RepID=UPI00345DB2CA